jgi:DNA gyrase subunit A
MVVTVTHSGYIKRTPSAQYRSQRRGGKGVSGMDTKEEDWVERLYIGTTHDYMMFFTDRGKAYWLKVYELPQGGRATRGRPIVNLLELEKDEKIQAMIPVHEFDDEHFIVFVTAKGQLIKNALSLYSNPRKVGIKAVKIADDDRLVGAVLTDGQNEIFIGTRHGMAIRFHESDARPMGRDVAGVRGISLRDDDEVVGMTLARPGNTILTVCRKGYGKRSDIEDYRLIKRGGMGVINIRTSERNGDVIGILEVIDKDELIMITQQGMAVRSSVKDLRVIGRATQGVRLISLKPEDSLTSVIRIEESDEGAELASDDEPTEDQPSEPPKE